MKKKDLALIIVVVVVAGFFSFIICDRFLTTPQDRQQEVEAVRAISSTFDVPNNKIFNPEAFNPTKLIEIGPNANDQPFINQ